MAASEEADVMDAIIEAGEDIFLQVICSPISDERMFDQYKFVMISLQSLGH